MRRVRQRGSLCLYVAVLLLSLALLAGAIVPLATRLGDRTARRTDELRARLAFEAGMASVRSQSLTQRLVLGVPIAVTLNGVTATVTPQSNPSPPPNSLLVTGTAVRNGRTYRFSRVVGARQPAPYDFALFSKSSIEVRELVTGAGGENGDVFVNGDLKTSGNGTTINGNAWAKDDFDLTGNTVITGRRISGARAIPWPNANEDDYRSAAQGLVLSGRGVYSLLGATLTGITFLSPYNGAYACAYYAGNVSLKGTISGKGTVFVKGDLTISGDVTYASADSEVAFVVKGNINVSNATATMVGYYCTDGNLITQRALTVPRGAFAVAGLSTDKPLSIVRDNAVRSDTNEAVRLRLPYYWP